MLFAMVALAGDIVLPTPVPQDTDNDFRLQQRQAMSLATLAAATSTTGGASGRSSAALEASNIASAAGGSLISLTGYNSKASAQFIQVHNSATVPANGAVPIVTFTVPATSNFSLNFTTPMAFGAGIVVCNSSTATTKTLGSADCFFTIQYRQ